MKNYSLNVPFSCCIVCHLYAILPMEIRWFYKIKKNSIHPITIHFFPKLSIDYGAFCCDQNTLPIGQHYQKFETRRIPLSCYKIFQNSIKAKCAVSIYKKKQKMKIDSLNTYAKNEIDTEYIGAIFEFLSLLAPILSCELCFLSSCNHF